MANKLVDPRQRFPDLPMTEEETQTFMQLEVDTGRPVRSTTMAHIVLAILRAKDEAKLNKIAAFLEESLQT